MKDKLKNYSNAKLKHLRDRIDRQLEFNNSPKFKKGDVLYHPVKDITIKVEKIKDGDVYWANEEHLSFAPSKEFQYAVIGDDLIYIGDYEAKLKIFHKLLQKRDKYRNNWTPNWNHSDTKFIISNVKLRTIATRSIPYIFSFPTAEIRDRFLFNHGNKLKKIIEFLL